MIATNSTDQLPMAPMATTRCTIARKWTMATCHCFTVWRRRRRCCSLSWTMESNPIRAHCLMVGIHWSQHALHDNHYDTGVVPRWGKTVSVELWNSSDSSESFGETREWKWKWVLGWGESFKKWTAAIGDKGVDHVCLFDRRKESLTEWLNEWKAAWKYDWKCYMCLPLGIKTMVSEVSFELNYNYKLNKGI